MIIRSKAPLRISFAGGGTDVPPYPQERGGAVLNSTINKYTYGTIISTDERSISVHSLDYDIVAKYHSDADPLYDGKLDLVKAAVKHMLKSTDHRGMNLFLHSDAPPGSGLGSSSSMVVTLIGLFKHWLRRPMTDYEIAELAYQIERVDLGIEGGLQDQYAATFGGFNFIEFNGPTVIVNPLRVDPAHINELEYHLLLCYTGKTRLSANILSRQIDSVVRKEVDVMAALDVLKEIAVQMKNALLQGHLDEFGELLHHAWQDKKVLDSQISNSDIDRMYETARRHGAIGGKISGAGGGGYLLLYCPFDRKHIIAEKLEQIGGQIVEFGFEPRGLQTWQVNS